MGVGGRIPESIMRGKFVLRITVWHQEACLIEILQMSTHIIWASTRENLSLGVANNKGPDQPAHPRRLISTLVIPILESLISKLATCEISIFLLVSVAGETGLILALIVGNPEDRFCRVKAHMVSKGKYRDKKLQKDLILPVQQALLRR